MLRASVNATDLGEHAFREDAMARVEALPREMALTLEDWSTYTAARKVR
ncbi:MAG TPA: hypothetical protein VFE34_15505 [Dongiaceae bacterium]|nr:hypothetical protein [Dongiaceae bacterium]